MSQDLIVNGDRPIVAGVAGGPVVPRVIAAAGDQAARRFLEFFAATIRNKNTRMAYYRAAERFFAWCDHHKVGEIADIEPLHVAAYVEARQGFREADGQAASRLDPHAVRLARRWPDRRHQSGAFGARSEARRQNREDHGAHG